MGDALKRYQQYCLDVDYAAEWLEYAEYAVAELEAELAGTQLALNAITKGNMEACTQRNEAQAELAALKAEQGLHIEYVSVNEYGEELVACQAELAALKARHCVHCRLAFVDCPRSIELLDGGGTMDVECCSEWAAREEA